MQVLEHVGKETIDLLIAETDIEVDKKSTELADEDQLLEEVTFDRYFYRYGGFEQLEWLLSQNHHSSSRGSMWCPVASSIKLILIGKLKNRMKVEHQPS
ncbi:hypothetical protein ACET3Z_013524 [Daucus carota]